MALGEPREPDEFEGELRYLISELEAEQEKLTRRLVSAREALTAVEQKKGAVEQTLQALREKEAHDGPGAGPAL